MQARAAYSGWALMPVPTAVPPSGTVSSSSRAAWARRIASSTWPAYPANSWPSRIGVASWRCVRPVLTTSQNSLDLAASAAWRSIRAGISSSSIAIAPDSWSAVGIVSFEDWHLLTSSLGWTFAPPRRADARWLITSFMLVLVEVPEPGLVHVDREVLVPAAVGDLARRGGDRGGLRGVEQPEAGVGLGGGDLHQRERAQEPARHALARDREVEDRPLGRRAVHRVRGDLHLAHGVPLDPGGGGSGSRVVVHGAMVRRRARRRDGPDGRAAPCRGDDRTRRIAPGRRCPCCPRILTR